MPRVLTVAIILAVFSCAESTETSEIKTNANVHQLTGYIQGWTHGDLIRMRGELELLVESANEKLSGYECFVLGNIRGRFLTDISMLDAAKISLKRSQEVYSASAKALDESCRTSERNEEFKNRASKLKTMVEEISAAIDSF